MKDVLSDYIIGVILFAITVGIIRSYKNNIFQIPIVDINATGIPLPFGVVDQGFLFIRIGLPHTRRLFLDSNGLPLIFHGFLFIGATGFSLTPNQFDLIPRFPYIFHNLYTHPNYI